MIEDTIRRLGVEAIERVLEPSDPDREAILEAMETVMRVRELFGRVHWTREDGEAVLAIADLLRPLRGLK